MKTFTERFWEKVQTDKNSDCWVWTASLDKDGYGRFGVMGKMCRAHRVALEIEAGPIPDGLEVDHLCRNKGCVRPSHLEAVTGTENLARAKPYWPDLKNKDFCSKGHALTEVSTYSEGGRRRCRACKNERNKRHRSSQRGQR